MRPLRNHLLAAGIPVENSKGEAEAGQEELNIRYGEALDCADHHTIAKHAVKEITWASGKAARKAGLCVMPRESRIAPGQNTHNGLRGEQGAQRAAEGPRWVSRRVIPEIPRRVLNDPLTALCDGIAGQGVEGSDLRGHISGAPEQSIPSSRPWVAEDVTSSRACHSLTIVALAIMRRKCRIEPLA